MHSIVGVFIARPRASLSQGGFKRFSVVLGVFRFAPLLALLSLAALLFSFSPLVVLSWRGSGFLVVGREKYLA